MKLPAYIRDRISAAATMFELLGSSTTDARSKAIAKVAKETGFKNIKPSALRKPSPPAQRRSGGAAFAVCRTRAVMCIKICCDVVAPFKRSSPPSTPHSPVTTGRMNNNRRATLRRSQPRRSVQPSPP